MIWLALRSHISIVSRNLIFLQRELHVLKKLPFSYSHLYSTLNAVPTTSTPSPNVMTPPISDTNRIEKKTLKNSVISDLKLAMERKESLKCSTLKLMLNEINRIEKESSIKEIDEREMEIASKLYELAKLWTKGTKEYKVLMDKYEKELAQFRRNDNMALSESSSRMQSSHSSKAFNSTNNITNIPLSKEEEKIKSLLNQTASILAKEEEQINILMNYLPKAKESSEIESFIRMVIQDLNLTLPSPRSFGLIMKICVEKTDPMQYPRKVLSDLVKQIISPISRKNHFSSSTTNIDPTASSAKSLE